MARRRSNRARRRWRAPYSHHPKPRQKKPPKPTEYGGSTEATTELFQELINGTRNPDMSLNHLPNRKKEPETLSFIPLHDPPKADLRDLYLEEKRRWNQEKKARAIQRYNNWHKPKPPPKRTQ